MNKYKVYNNLKKSSIKPTSVSNDGNRDNNNNNNKVFKTPTKPLPSSSITPSKKVQYLSPTKPQTPSKKIHQSPIKSTTPLKSISFTPRTKARKRLRGENVPNTPNKQRILRVDGIIDEKDDSNYDGSNNNFNDNNNVDDDDDDDDIRTPAKPKSKSFKPLLDSPKPSNSANAINLPPIPTSQQSLSLTSSSTTTINDISNSQQSSQQSSQQLSQQKQQQSTSRGLKRPQASTNSIELSKKKSKSSLKNDYRIQLPKSKTLIDKSQLKIEKTQIQIEDSINKLSIIPHMRHKQNRSDKSEADIENDTDNEIEDIPLNYKHSHTFNESSNNNNNDNEDKRDSPTALKRSNDYKKVIDEKVKNLFTNSFNLNDEVYVNLNYNNHLDAEQNELNEIKDEEDDDWDDTVDGWKSDGIGFIEEYDCDY